MKESEVYIDQHKFIRERILKLLNEVSGSADSTEALHWMLPFGKPGRAHMAWQFMHCAATLDRYLNVRILSASAKNQEMIDRFAGGSKPDPDLIVSPEEIKSYLMETTEPYYRYVLSLDDAVMMAVPNPELGRTYREALQLLNWHEAHHHGQCQIIWNSFRSR